MSDSTYRSTEWRGWESNPRHHDFQAETVSTHLGIKSLQMGVTGFARRAEHVRGLHRIACYLGHGYLLVAQMGARVGSRGRTGGDVLRVHGNRATVALV